MARNAPRSGRRTLLAVALTALVATAGCTGALTGGDASGSGSAQLDSVPNDATMVGHVDAAGMVGDDSLRGLVNTALETRSENSEFYAGPTSVGEALDQLENQSGLDPSNVHGVTFFGSASESVSASTEASGTILSTDFSTDDLVSAMEASGTEFAEESYQDTTLYTYGYESQNALAALGSGTFATGDVDAVKSVLDVDAGEADALSGALRSQFTSTDDGYVRFAASVPQGQVPAEQFGQGTQMNTSSFNTVQYVSGSLSASGDSVTTRVNLVSQSSDDASRIYDVVDGALSLYSGVGGDEVRSLIEQVEVSENGDTVTVSFTDAVGDLEDRIESLYSTSMAGSASASGSASSTSATANATT